MDKSTAQGLVRETFKAAFDKKRFHEFIAELCNGFEKPETQTMTVPDAFKPHVKNCQRLGTFTSDEGELADILVVHLTESFKLERTRTALRDFVAHKLKRGSGEDNAYKEAGLVAFVAPDAQSWRFSFVRMDYVNKRDPKTNKIKTEERLTPARRYSYLVGTAEQCHTAQSRFVPLLQNPTGRPTLAQIEAAFSVELVTKEFFKQYAALFESMQRALDDIVAQNSTLKLDFQAKKVATADFTKKLLGQIVFLYFIQKKGWLGVALGGSWGDGPHDFMRRLIDKAILEKQCFFNDVLEPLFYDTLATDRGNAAWCEPFQCRIPFLNGGLFEPLAGYDWAKTNINFDNTLFSNKIICAAGDTGTGILDVFDRYNFTVNEAEPLEKEVAIDPEMLGKVFENLIEDNRRKGLGAFYTPREIVHYMCQESLISYLDNGLNRPVKPRVETIVVPHKDIEDWIRQSDQFAHYAAAVTAGTKGEHYPKPPDSIRACAADIDALLRDITVCDPAVGSGAFPVGMMTEIVRARMSLTHYFKDAAERTAYHFKRHAIQNCLYGVDIDSGAVEIAKLRLWLSLVVDELDVQHIKPLPNLDYKIVAGDSLLGFPFRSTRLIELEKLKIEYFNETNRDMKLILKDEIDLALKMVFASSQASLGYEVNFDYLTYFSEVFHKSGGFDVVIANPPYVQIKDINPSHRKVFEKQYKFATGRFNLFYLFIERSKILSKPGGVNSFIIPDRLLLNTQCCDIRYWLINSNQINEIVSFGDQVFETAVVDSIVLIFQNFQNSVGSIQARCKVVGAKITDTAQRKIPLTYFELSPTSQFDLNYTPEKQALLNKIISGSIFLEDISETRDGIIQSKIGEQLFIDFQKNDQCRKLLFGMDVNFYSIFYRNRWVDYRPSEMGVLEQMKGGSGLRLRNKSIFECKKNSHTSDCGSHHRCFR